ncbi:hypothetical protein NE865_06086 [Phthorimaea operculella]|nr:hypothetical protein NE865_06086 [Phthorimaea operculella]
MSGKWPRPRPPRRRDELTEKQQDVLLAWSDEVCNSEEVPEVEIVSLLQEHIPKYRLRADSLTQFGGYENQDWFIPSPALPVSDKDLALTPDQIRETLNYFLLCSNRVSQMTKTYNDIEAVTRLLEEKEKDLELTARIGKQLLATNARLEATVNSLEGELRSARDQITQLRHDLSAKTELLQVTVICKEKDKQLLATNARLEATVNSLEGELRSARDQITQLRHDLSAKTELLQVTVICKEKDKQLLATNARLEATVNSLEGELRSARDQITQLRHDLSAKTELLQVLTNDTEDVTTPTEPEPPGAAALRKRTGALERENRALREEAARLAAGADQCELAEQQLLRDIAHQLASANSEASVLGNELVEERQRSAELQQQFDLVNARLAATERNYQQSEAAVLGNELVEERQRSAELQQQFDLVNARLAATERNYQQSEAAVLGNELVEERQRSAELQQQFDLVNARLAATERNYQQVSERDSVIQAAVVRGGGARQ